MNRQRLIVAALISAEWLYWTAVFLLDSRPFTQKGVFPQLVLGAALMSLPSFVGGHNWARRTLLIATICWTIAGATEAILDRSAAGACAALVSLGAFVWMMRAANRAEFIMTPRNWGFARTFLGVLMLWVKAFPSRGRIPLLEAANEDQALGIMIGDVVMVLFAIWLIWTGARRWRAEVTTARRPAPVYFKDPYEALSVYPCFHHRVVRGLDRPRPLLAP